MSDRQTDDRSRFAHLPGRLVRMPPSALSPNPRNPRSHPAAQIEKLRASLRARGQYRPVIARAANTMLIAGHGLVQAAIEEGLAEVDVMLLDVSQEQADALLLADNEIALGAKDNKAQKAELLVEIDPELWPSVGFTAEQGADLLKPLDDSHADVIRLDTSPIHDEAWMTVTTPLARQADVLQRLQELMAEFPDTTVQVGTTPRF